MNGNNNNPAFPTGSSHGGMGLTKREYFAAVALQGLCANRNLILDYNTDIILQNGPVIFSEMVTAEAVRIADDLLKQLEKPQK